MSVNNLSIGKQPIIWVNKFSHIGKQPMMLVNNQVCMSTVYHEVKNLSRWLIIYHMGKQPMVLASHLSLGKLSINWAKNQKWE